MPPTLLLFLLILLSVPALQGLASPPPPAFASNARPAFARGAASSRGGAEAAAPTHREASEAGEAGSQKAKVVFVLGGPGAGKGTQCARLASHFPSFRHLSVGDLLRREQADPASKDGRLIKGVIDGGGLVPVELSLRLLRRAMEGAMEECRGKTTTTTTPTTTFLVDGFPRNFENLEGWERTMAASARVLCVLVYDVGVEELRRRILERGETSGRTDDNVKAAEKRFRTFERETVPVIKRIEREGGWRVERLEGEKGPEEVWERTRRLMEEVLAGEDQAERGTRASFARRGA